MPAHRRTAGGREPVPRPREPARKSPPADDRPRLPRREPQQNLVAQLETEPDESQDEVVAPGEGTARTLAAFHKGTRRGRGGPDDA